MTPVVTCNERLPTGLPFAERRFVRPEVGHGIETPTVPPVDQTRQQSWLPWLLRSIERRNNDSDDIDVFIEWIGHERTFRTVFRRNYYE